MARVAGAALAGGSRQGFWLSAGRCIHDPAGKDYKQERKDGLRVFV